MDMHTKHKSLTTVLFLVPSNPDEAAAILDFARPAEPIAAELKKSPDYTWPHLEITKYL